MRLPRQFTLRALLVLITAAAGFLGWYALPPKGEVTIKQTSRVQRGMTQADVRSILGSPAKDDGETWEYIIVGPTIDEHLRRLRITFKDGRALQVLHANSDFP